MKWQIRKCLECRRYTLKQTCPICGKDTVIPHPAKFSPQDRYAKYKSERSSQGYHQESGELGSRILHH